MKNNNIKIAVIEEGNFYNHLLDGQILDLSEKMNFQQLNWVIDSFDNSETFIQKTKFKCDVIVINNYSNRNNNQNQFNSQNVIHELKQKNRDCLLISISGYREMLITGELYKNGELCFYYLKQSNTKNQNFEETCSVPALYKLMTKLVLNIKQKSEATTSQKRGTHKLRISA